MQQLFLNKDFNWTNECRCEFNQIIKEIASKPCLTIFAENEEITIETDASMHAVAAIMSQNGHPVIFLSKKLTPTQQKWANIDREAYAIYWSITRLRQYLQ